MQPGRLPGDWKSPPLFKVAPNRSYHSFRPKNTGFSQIHSEGGLSPNRVPVRKGYIHTMRTVSFKAPVWIPFLREVPWSLLLQTYSVQRIIFSVYCGWRKNEKRNAVHQRGGDFTGGPERAPVFEAGFRTVWGKSAPHRVRWGAALCVTRDRAHNVDQYKQRICQLRQSYSQENRKKPENSRKKLRNGKFLPCLNFHHLDILNKILLHTMKKRFKMTFHSEPKSSC